MRTLPGICLVAVLFVASTTGLPRVNGKGKTWALLVAGSNGYDNYRHQADICHAYQLLHKNGFKDEHIIVMMYDDIARNERNPTPGVIINKPNGTDVYHGVPIDYSGDDVSAENFLAVMSGQSDKLTVSGTSTRRVIESGPNDIVFVNFADHGAEGILGFPNDFLYASQLQKTLNYMTQNQLYKKMVLYIEACNAGSMFDGLLSEDANILAITASATDESSYATYWDDSKKAYLGDLFSVKWMEDSDVEILDRETVNHQFQLVRRLTTQSHVEAYGDLDLGDLNLSTFQGWKLLQGARRFHQTRKADVPVSALEDAISSRDVPVETLRRVYEGATETNEKMEARRMLNQKLELRRHLDTTVSEIVEKVADGDESKKASLLESKTKYSPSIIPCYEPLVEHFSSKCFHLSKNTYALTKTKVFVNLCTAFPSSFQAAIEAMDHVCGRISLLSGIH